MNIADLIALDRVVVPLRVNDKAQLLRELAQRAARFLSIDLQVILDALQTREALGSTGVGQGIA
jgi:PTS system nitrogen regulatory IIA component